MAWRVARIQINPRNRFDLSHLSAEEGHHTLEHFLKDLCFWGSLPAPIAANAASHNSSSYYYHRNLLQQGDLLRQKSSGSDQSRSSSRHRGDGGRRGNGGSRPPRNQPPARVWKTAVDPSTGQTYYYDPVSRQTQWEKVRSFEVSLAHKSAWQCCWTIGIRAVAS